MAKATSQVTKEIQTLADLTPDPRNARKHNPRNVGLVERALNEVGAARSIVIDESGVVLAGNATIEAAGRAGIEKVQVVDADGETIIAVRRTGLTQAQKTRLALFDNRTAELADWDADIIARLVAEDDKALDGLFENNELLELIESLEQTGNADAEPQIDRAAELNEKWQVKPHDLWQIGDHRLLCGDSTVRADVERVMGGDKCDMIFTDPPYGVNYEYAEHKDDPKQYEKLADGFWGAKPSAPLCVLTVGHKWNNFWFAKNPNGFLVWFDKTKQSPSNIAHLCKSELMLIFGKVYERFAWDTLEIQQPRNDGLRELHTCPKPLELWEKIIEVQKGAAIIYEPFAGSGTTLVACQNLSRKCRAIEISPNYCAVILERMVTAFPAIIVERAK